MATTAGSPPVIASPTPPALPPGSRVFIDTNVLVYASTPAAPFHAEAVAVTNSLQSGGADLWISRQVLREYLATLTRQQTYQTPPLAVLLTNVAALEAALRIAEDGPAVTAHLLTLLGQVSCAGKQVHDANIVATMLAHGISNLLTNNVGDFTRFSTYITVVPLVSPAPPPGGTVSPGSPPPPGVP